MGKTQPRFQKERDGGVSLSRLLGISVRKHPTDRGFDATCHQTSRLPRSPGLVRRRSHFTGGLFDERGHRIRLRHVDRVTARDLGDSRTRALGHEALGRRWDHLVVGSNQVPARLGLPSRLADRAAERVHAPWDLGGCHERGPFCVHVTRE